MPDDFNLRCLDRELLNSPTSATVSLSGAGPRGRVRFKFAGDQVWTETASIDGQLIAVSIPIPEKDAGTYTLRAEMFNDSSTYDTVSITLAKDSPGSPRLPGMDASPVFIAQPGSNVRKWVLQDLMPGGLGSYVLPISPSTMTSPHPARLLTAAATLAPGGTLETAKPKGFFWQQGYAAREWSFAGYCATKEQYQQMFAFSRLKRRCYVIDHRNRAWITVITKFDVTKRQAYRPRWSMDYQVSALIYNEHARTPQ